jgi:hypothetical protein
MEMDIYADPAIGDFRLIKRQIWEKFTRELQEWRESQFRDDGTLTALPDMNPDVIVIPKGDTILFEPRTPRASSWFRNRYRLSHGDLDGDHGVLVHPMQQKQLTDELKAAGFAVAE